MNPLEYICQELQEYIQYEDNPCNLDNPFNLFQPDKTPISNNCRQYKRNQEHKWILRNSKGSSWWDKKTLEKTIIQKGKGMRTPKYGDIVTIDYVIKTSEGNGIDWTRKPLQFRVGDSNMITGVNRLICTMKKNEIAKLYIPAEMAFGWNPHQILNIKPMTDIIMKITLNKIKV